MAKSPNAFRTISEASDEVGSPQHVLRFWETKFAFIVPLKRAGGRRFYRPQDIVVLKAIKRLLHEEGLTIRGVQRLHKELGLNRLAAYGDSDAAFEMDVASSWNTPKTDDNVGGLADVLARIETARARLDAVLAR